MVALKGDPEIGDKFNIIISKLADANDLNTRARVEATEHLEREKTRLRPEAERIAKENDEANRRELAAAKPAEPPKTFTPSVPPAC